ncbi:MAG TPA: hypothetical protein VMI10_14205 [Terriglobales bacterium]|nr:hypothetical protein [Terriglobales bacterium]
MKQLSQTKFLVLSFILAMCVASPSIVMAQKAMDHLEIGAFADYFRLDRTSPTLNFAGLGGRVGFGINPYVQIEAEMAYDFDRTFVNFDNGVTGSYTPAKTHILHGLFGPKFHTGSGPVRFFVTGKAGIISFTTNNQDAPAGFESSLGAVGNGNSKFAVYPGGGLEGFVGPIGLRLEVGDDIYFDNGAQNNLRVTFGPTFRF